MNRPNRGIAIIGPGRLGQALGKLLADAGFPVAFVAARRVAAARSAVRFIGLGRPILMHAPELGGASIFLVTTADAALAPVARRLASLRRDWTGRIVLHVSGSLPGSGPRSPLAPLKRRGAATGSLHPFQTIPNPQTGVRNLKGCFWAIEGDCDARDLARRWVRVLDGVAFRVRPEQKILYHAAAFLTCPAVATLMERSARLLKRSGVSAQIARPMLGRFVAETAKNFVDLGPRRALTGPAARGDWPTIRKHLAALRQESPEFVPAYKELVRAMAGLAGRRIPRGMM